MGAGLWLRSVGPAFPCVCLSGTRTRLSRGERAREGRPLAGANSPQSGPDAKPARTHPCPPTLQAFSRCDPKSGCARVSDSRAPTGLSASPNRTHRVRRKGGSPRRKAWRPRPAPRDPEDGRPSVAPLGRAIPTALILAPNPYSLPAPPPIPLQSGVARTPSPPDSALA